LQIAVVLLDDSEARKFVAGTGGFEPRRHCILENHDLRGCWQRTQKKPGSSFYMQLEWAIWKAGRRSGKQIRKGQAAIAVTAAANRNPEPLSGSQPLRHFRRPLRRHEPRVRLLSKSCWKIFVLSPNRLCGGE